MCVYVNVTEELTFLCVVVRAAAIYYWRYF